MADDIQVDFITLRDDEDMRRVSMLKSFEKLAKKASRHCNKSVLFRLTTTPLIAGGSVEYHVFTYP